MEPHVLTVPIDAALRQQRETCLRAHLDAERAADTEGIIDTFSHPRYELVGAGRVFDGADQVRGYLRDRHRVFPDLATEVIAFWHADDVVAAGLWLTGTYADPQSVGRRFRCRTACFFEFDGPGLVGVRAYFDTGTIARQLA